MERILLRVTPRELGGSAADVRGLEARLDHRTKIGGFVGPVLLLHTRFDGLVDVSHALRLKRWATGDVTLRLFEEGDHNSILWENSDEYLAAVADFLRTVKARQFGDRHRATAP